MSKRATYIFKEFIGAKDDPLRKAMLVRNGSTATFLLSEIWETMSGQDVLPGDDYFKPTKEMAQCVLNALSLETA